MTHGVILYGPPAAGKDTITTHLHALNPTYVPFPRLKAGACRVTGYRITTPEALDQLAEQGAIVRENTRYGARYASTYRSSPRGLVVTSRCSTSARYPPSTRSRPPRPAPGG